MGIGTDFVLGGLLAGVGRGMEQSEIENRRVALERLRMQNENQRLADADKRAVRTAETAQDYTLEREGVEQKHALERLDRGGQIQSQRDSAEHGRRLQLEQLQSRLRRSERAAELQLADRLDSDDVTNVIEGADGNYHIVTRGGTVENSGVPFHERAPSTATTEGGRLSEDEREIAFNAARRRWIQGGRQGPEPQREDFIGMTREDYRSNSGGGASSQGSNRRIRYDARGNRIG